MLKNKFLIILLLLLPLTTAAQTSTAQTAAVKTAAVSVQTFQLNSKLTARQMPYNVVLPLAYEKEKTARFPVLYLLHGLSGNYKNWVEKTKLTEYAAAHRIIIVTVEGGNGWYSDSATVPNDRYESYIVEELIPEVDKNFRTDATRKARAIAGLSMGGYGAIKFGAKFPDQFVFAAGLSGAVSIASWQKADQVPQFFRQMILNTFGDETNAVKKDNDLFRIFNEMPAEKAAALPFFYFDCGTEDELGLLAANQQLAAILVGRKIPHEFRQLPGKHSWTLWDKQIVEVLRISERIFGEQNAKTK